jgi:hypothetical protein
MNSKDARPRPGIPAQRAASAARMAFPATAAIPTAAPNAKRIAPESNAPYSASLDKLRNGKPRTWAAWNNKVGDQDRVIAVKSPEGRYIHSSCSDATNVNSPATLPFPVCVPANMAAKLAAAGGLLCAHCNTFIVAPVNKRGVEKAEGDWERANRSYTDGKLSKEAFLAAAQRFASSRD